MGIFGWVEHHLILVDGMLLIYFGRVSIASKRNVARQMLTFFRMAHDCTSFPYMAPWCLS